MKTIAYLILGILFFPSQLVDAQVQLDTVYISDNDSSSFVEIRYYYYPNLQAYFDTKKALYIYKENGVWTTSKRMAPNYRGYSLFNSSYVMIEGYSGEEPYSLLSEHKLKYPANFSGKRQPKPIATSD